MVSLFQQIKIIIKFFNDQAGLNLEDAGALPTELWPQNQRKIQNVYDFIHFSPKVLIFP